MNRGNNNVKFMIGNEQTNGQASEQRNDEQ